MAEPDGVLELGDGAGGWARCGLWWSPPRPSVVPLGRIGRLQASGPAGAAQLLERACADLRRHGCASVLAPLDGDTWHPYRVLEPDQDPGLAFAGEPDPDPRWTDWLAAAGFAVQARYVSSLCTDLQRRRPTRSSPTGSSPTRSSPLLTTPSPFHLVPVAHVAIDALLEPIHALISHGFRRQPLFVPISLADFRRHWEPWRTRLDPDLSLLAFEGADLVGLLLAHQDGSAAGRAVVRTLVVQPGRRWAGLGRRLLERCHGRAAALGFTAVVHALMHDPGPSVALSRPYARPFRRYVLMGRRLGG
jgi:GNAT superfamily N-acetyltransferase